MDNPAVKHIRIYDSLKSGRASLENYWQQLTYYSLPRKAYITRTKNIGDKLPNDIYDSTAIISLAYFAAGMQAYMSSPQTKWFALGMKDKGIMQKKSVMNYLKDAEAVIYNMINDSNFYQEDVEGYLSLGSVGNDVLFAEEDTSGRLVFDSLPIESVVLDWDQFKRVTTAYLEYEFSAFQALEKFGKSVSEEIKKTVVAGDHNKRFTYILAVFPRGIYDQSKKDSKNMPFAALWIDKKEKTIAREGGFKTFPFFTSVFAKSKSDPYGYSPQMNIQADIQMLNAMEKNNILTAQLNTRPPLEIPDEAFLKPYNFNPGGKNFRAAGFANEHIIPINTGGNLALGLDYVQYKQARIQQAFYNDLFVNMEQMGKMTATEVQIRNNQRMQLLGSSIGNIMRGKHSPVIEYVFRKAAEQGKLPQLPRELVGLEYEVIYISPLAKAQKALELNNVNEAMSIIAGFGSVNPEVFDKVDFDEAVNYVADITNLNPRIIRDEAEVEDIRLGRQEQQMQAAQMEMINAGANIQKTASEADKNLAQVGAE